MLTRDTQRELLAIARAALEAHQRKASAETQDLIASLIKEEFAERP